MGSRAEDLRAAFTSFISLRSVDVNLVTRSLSSAHGCFQFIFLSVIGGFSGYTFLGNFVNGMIFVVILYSSIQVQWLFQKDPSAICYGPYCLPYLLEQGSYWNDSSPFQTLRHQLTSRRDWSNLLLKHWQSHCRFRVFVVKRCQKFSASPTVWYRNGSSFPLGIAMQIMCMSLPTRSRT
jgi:hypothetical protein